MDLSIPGWHFPGVELRPESTRDSNLAWGYNSFKYFRWDVQKSRIPISCRIGGWGEWDQPGNRFVSCRACVRACARSGCLVRIRWNSGVASFPFPFWPREVFPFPLWDLVSPGESKWVQVSPAEIEVKSQINQSEIKDKSNWNRSYLEVKPKWYWSELEVKPQLTRSEFEVNSKWNRS